jgi:hypothetical protein
MMTSEYTALLAAMVLGTVFALGLTGASVVTAADNVFGTQTAHFSAKFIKP